jgi:hypothetical protein
MPFFSRALDKKIIIDYNVLSKIVPELGVGVSLSSDGLARAKLFLGEILNFMFPS